MPKSQNQKLKLMYLQKFLFEESDEAHPVTINQMIDYLAGLGISAERKSLYDDLEQLRLFGNDIISVKKKGVCGYFIVSRSFETSELKLLVDAVQGSKFITKRKSEMLIKKLESLCSRHEAAALSRQTLVTNRIKSMNESIYYNVDKIHSAIGKGRCISFYYFDYNKKLERVLRHGGALYWDDENYYLIAYDHLSEMIRHYRVDKMLNISINDEKRKGKEAFDELDIEMYSKKVFSMFGGKATRVGMEFDDSLCGAVIDRFGKDIMLRDSENEGKFYINTDVVISPHFFGWLFSFGDKAKLISPQNAADEFSDYAKNVIKMYEQPTKSEFLN